MTKNCFAAFSRLRVFSLTLLRYSLIAIAGSFVLIPAAEAALLQNVPITLRQPDGTVVRCFVTGDEYHNYIHDRQGDVAVQDPKSRYWVYAKQVNGHIQPGKQTVGRAQSKSSGVPGARALRLQPNRARFYDAHAVSEGIEAGFGHAMNAAVGKPAFPTTGTVNNIVVFVRFSDDPEFNAAIAEYSSLFNADSDGAVSLYSYFKEASYGQLAVASYFYPGSTGSVVSFVDDNPRAYYQPYDAGSNLLGYKNDSEYVARERAFVNRAVASIRDQVPPSVEVDANGDGFVDNVCLVLQGNPDGWGSLLWPHQSFADETATTIHDKRIGAYNIQIDGILMPDYVGVLCHEFYHSMGAPDLYRYSQQVGAWFDAVGAWDLMASSPRTPQHMNAYLKYRYGGWLALPPLISQDGDYSLSPLTSPTNNAYRIASPYSSTEYFLLEFRKQSAPFEQSLPGAGMLVYRIHTARETLGNAYGPPDEVYLYRPSGTPFTNGSLNYAFFSADSGRTSISDLSNPAAFLSGGGSGGLYISEIGTAGGRISFHVRVQHSGHTVSKPAIISGPAQGKSNVPYAFDASEAVDSMGQPLQYRYYWDNGVYSDWVPAASAINAFFGDRSYDVRVQARSSISPDIYSDWSEPFLVSIDFETPAPFYLKQRLPAATDPRMMIYSMARGDVDGDGKEEVIAMYAYLPTDLPKDRLQDLVVYGWQNGRLQRKWHRTGSSVTYPEGWNLIAADIDGDGRAEILKDSEVIQFDSGKYVSSPMPLLPVAVGDANNDGQLEVVDYSGLLYWFQNGNWLEAGSIQASGPLSRVAIGDTDGDGAAEVVVACGNGPLTGSVTILRAAAGAEFSVLYQKVQWLNVFTDLKIADWDSDGTNEVILANDEESSVHILKFDGSTYSEIWSHSFYAYSGMGWIPSLAMGRFNPATQGNDLVIGLGGHCQQPAEGSGVYLEGVGMLLHDSDKGMGVGSLLIMDVDADGHQEVVAGSTDGYLYILSTRAAPTRRNPLRTHGRTVSGHNRIMNAADL